MNSSVINKLYNTNVDKVEALVSPTSLRSTLPLSAESEARILAWRETVENILDRKDHRLLVVVGPCSIHDEEQAIDYATRLQKLSEQVSDSLFIVMRVYFEKPRTTVGWKGLINDPYLNNSFDLATGLHKARKLLITLADMGLPTGTEALDPIVPQYIQELISWSAIGARTSESQTHREMASGLSMPVGFKNGTDGSIDIALNALQSAASPHKFLGITEQGEVAIVNTKGNAYGHVVLRGGNNSTNYDAASIAQYEELLTKAKQSVNLLIDASHANSGKKAENQEKVLDDITSQIQAGNTSIIGAMIESNIGWGNQSLNKPEDLQYGVSITDACIDWQTTERVLLSMADKLSDPLRSRISGV